MKRNLSLAGQLKTPRASKGIFLTVTILLILTPTYLTDEMEEEVKKPFKFSKKTGDISLKDIQQIYEEDPLIDEELDRRVEEATVKMLQMTIEACVDHISDKTPNFKKKKGKKKENFGPDFGRLKKLGRFSSRSMKKKRKKRRRRKRQLEDKGFEITLQDAKKKIVKKARIEDEKEENHKNTKKVHFDEMEGAPVQILRKFEPKAQIARKLKLKKERELKLLNDAKSQIESEKQIKEKKEDSNPKIQKSENDKQAMRVKNKIDSDAKNSLNPIETENSQNDIKNIKNPKLAENVAKPDSLKISSQNLQKIADSFKNRTLRLKKNHRRNFKIHEKRRSLKMREKYDSSAYESQPEPKRKKKTTKRKKSQKKTAKLKLNKKRKYKARKMQVKILKNSKRKKAHKKKRKKRKLFGMPGGGGSVVVAPNQGAGIANAQVVVNSLGTPATIPYAEGNAVPAYAPEDTAPKVIVTRMKMPSNLPYIV